MNWNLLEPVKVLQTPWGISSCSWV